MLEIKLNKHQLFDRVCVKKHSYDTRKRARQAAREATMRSGKKFREYRCQFCGDYHLTTKERSNGS